MEESSVFSHERLSFSQEETFLPARTTVPSRKKPERSCRKSDAFSQEVPLLLARRMIVLARRTIVLARTPILRARTPVVA
jgi:hypothetical protein